jgi:hypothetical protein
VIARPARRTPERSICFLDGLFAAQLLKNLSFWPGSGLDPLAENRKPGDRGIAMLRRLLRQQVEHVAESEDLIA